MNTYGNEYDVINEPVTVVNAYTPSLHDWRPVPAVRCLFGRNVQPQADPDALLEPELSTASRPWGQTLQAIQESLDRHGPATVRQLAARIGRTPNAIRSQLQRPERLAETGIRCIGQTWELNNSRGSGSWRNVYGLERHPDLPPPAPGPGRASPIDGAMLAANGQWQTVSEIAEAAGVTQSAVRNWTKVNAPLVERWEQRVLRACRLPSGETVQAAGKIVYWRLKQTTQEQEGD